MGLATCMCLPFLQSMAVCLLPCVHHCHSTSVPSPLAPPLIMSSLDSQTLCPEQRKGGEGRRRRRGGGGRGEEGEEEEEGEGGGGGAQKGKREGRR